jgi:hypothetical protein
MKLILGTQLFADKFANRYSGAYIRACDNCLSCEQGVCTEQRVLSVDMVYTDDGRTYCLYWQSPFIAVKNNNNKKINMRSEHFEGNRSVVLLFLTAISHKRQKILYENTGGNQMAIKSEFSLKYLEELNKAHVEGTDNFHALYLEFRDALIDDIRDNAARVTGKAKVLAAAKRILKDAQSDPRVKELHYTPHTVRGIQYFFNNRVLVALNEGSHLDIPDGEVTDELPNYEQYFRDAFVSKQIALTWLTCLQKSGRVKQREKQKT